MNLESILFFVARAAKFSLITCALYAPARLLYLSAARRKPNWKNEAVKLLFAAYIAALAEIIALRGGMGDRRDLQLIPLTTTRRIVQNGLWSMVYNFGGNIAWFVPLGMFLHRKKPARTVLIGAAVSMMLEICQYLLKTGVTDIDDVLFNALGALVGALAMKLWNKYKTNGMQS